MRGSDSFLLFLSRSLRLFGFGIISLTLPLHLTALDFSPAALGLLLTLTLVGDTVVSLGFTLVADRWGRKTVLLIGAGLMLVAGVAFVVSHDFVWLLIAAIGGIISPSGNEVGPFLALEQASLSQIVPERKRTRVFAWYNLAGSVTTALGALAAGWFVIGVQGLGGTVLEACRLMAGLYAAIGLVLIGVFFGLSPRVEVPRNPQEGPAPRLGLHGSQKVVFKLSVLFSLDALGGGFIVQSLLAFWFHVQWGLDPGSLGTVLFVANLLAAGSSLVAARLADRFGLINTMVFTHIPSNVLLILIPFMPNLFWALTLLFLRFSISQMDVPTRQSYVMKVVAPSERSAAAGVTGLARTVGASFSPLLSGLILSSSVWVGAPFVLAGGIKIAYDLLLYRAFRQSESKETTPPPAPTDTA